MKTMFWGAACVLLPLFAAASPAMAQDDAIDGGEILVESPLLHPSAGIMSDHMHDAGEAMVGLRWERMRYSGRNQSGTDRIDDAAVLAAGYTARTSEMVMDMLMLDLMVGVTDNLTIMLMPHYMWHSMEMVGIDPASGAGHGGGHGGHGEHGGGLPFGERHSHSAEGFGDTLVSASYRLLRSERLAAHATLGLWVPTGREDLKNADGTFVHYGMQSGSGTWDVEPALTLRGQAGPVGWGVQGAYRWRTEEANKSGFAFGDRAKATAWLSTLLGRSTGATARVEYVHEGKVQGHYNGPHHHSSPPDRQENYGGDVVSAALGLNWLLPVGGVERPQLGVELGVPVYQDLKGIQAPQDWRLSVALSREF